MAGLTRPDRQVRFGAGMPGTLSGLFAGRVAPMPGDGRPTAIFKHPVDGSQAIGSQGLAVDTQADRRVHGGPEKALHQFSYSSLQRLREQFPESASEFKPGAMGENLSEPTMDEANVRIGDLYALGSARIQICQPRTPCWKVDARFGRDGLSHFLMQEGIAGWYYRVIAQGSAKVGDPFRLLDRTDNNLSIREFWSLMKTHRPDSQSLEAARAQPGLATYWIEKISRRIDWLANNVSASGT